jgi:hypothetical protein
MQRKLDMCLWDAERFATKNLDFTSGKSSEQLAAGELVRKLRKGEEVWRVPAQELPLMVRQAEAMIRETQR